MKIGGVEHTNEETVISELREAADFSYGFAQRALGSRPQIALLTPYSGHNLGDAAIQDSIIANLRLQLPGAQFSGISLNCDNFVERHAPRSFPLCGPGRPFYGMCRGKVADESGEEGNPGSSPADVRAPSRRAIRRVLKQVPILGWCLKRIRAVGRYLYGELLHCARGYQFLRTQDLLIVSGGGQLDEEWGGAWGHPFALYKWAVLARLARVPYAIASVGACKINSRACRVFLAAALRMAQYRSFRDKNSRALAAGLMRSAAQDPVVPDMAFSLPYSELPPPAKNRPRSGSRLVVAISPIAYAKPGTWVYEDAALYDRYLQEMARMTSQLLQRDYFLVIVWSGLSDDDRVVPEILERLDATSKQRATQQIHVPVIRSWKHLVALLQDVDLLVASRLHSTILGFVTQTPTVAISFDPKVDWVMEDVGQSDYLLHIHDFRAEDVIEALSRVELRSGSIREQIGSYQRAVHSASTRQYETLGKLASASHRRRN